MCVGAANVVNFAYFGMPGPLEMLVIGLVCVAPLIAAVVLVAVLRGGKASPPPPCRKCGGWTVPGTKFCPHCGSPLGISPPQGTDDGDERENQPE